MVTILTIAHITIAIFLAVVVLIQPGRGGGLVMGGGSQTLFGATGAGNFFTKLTTILMIAFVGTSIALTKSQTRSSRNSLFDSAPKSAAPATNPAPEAGAQVPGAAPAAANSQPGQTDAAPQTK